MKISEPRRFATPMTTPDGSAKIDVLFFATATVCRCNTGHSVFGSRESYLPMARARPAEGKMNSAAEAAFSSDSSSNIIPKSTCQHCCSGQDEMVSGPAAALKEDDLLRRLDDASSSLRNLSKRRRLEVLVEMRSHLEPILIRCNNKLARIEAAEKSPALTLDTLIPFAQRIACHLKAPPDYADPTGTVTTGVVPGYLFPCPNQSMLQRALLTRIGTAAPKIDVRPDPSNPILAVILIECPASVEAAGYGVCYSINASEPKRYIASRPPTLRPPGEYVLRAWVVDGRDSVRSHLAAVEVKLGGEELRGAAGSHPPSAPPARGPQPVTTGALSDLLVDVSSESESD
eukprot:GHVU01165166.1.p1 GENE.GHVU01165166.1~~GHVU01165166.1.p1  ORF type:complete len:345 (-),score=33.29 GHVU01165166.1:124-1158(-)